MTGVDKDSWTALQLDGGRWLLQCTDSPGPVLSRTIGAWGERLRKLNGVVDVVPGYRELAITTTQSQKDWRDWLEYLEIPSEEENVLHYVPVDYDGEDLKEFSKDKGMTVEKVIELHQEPIYTVAMVGFRPHFPYLLGLNPILAKPRRESPRVKVRAGAVAIGGDQTGIYPQESPGGWHILGYCDPKLCRNIMPGHQLRFEKRS